MYILVHFPAEANPLTSWATKSRPVPCVHCVEEHAVLSNKVYMNTISS